MTASEPAAASNAGPASPPPSGTGAADPTVNGATEGNGPPGSPPNQKGGSPNWLSLLTTVVSPIAVSTALLFYFGWVRADAQARGLGYDVSLLRYSTPDYVLRSVNVLFVPVIMILVLGLMFLRLHRRLGRWADRVGARDRRPPLGVWVTNLAWLWLPPMVLAAIALLTGATVPVVLPFALTAGFVVAVYSRVIERRLRGQGPPDRLTTAIVSALLVVLLFWDVERIAAGFGTAYSTYIKENPDEFPAVALHSSQRLDMSSYQVSSSVSRPRVSHRFQYSGFWLMNYANERYLLLARSATDGRTVVVVVPDTEEVQLAFD